MSVIKFPEARLCGHLNSGILPICAQCLCETVGEQVYHRACLIAKEQAPILIYGEIGTGKTLLAEFIHTISNRQRGPIQKRGCGQFPSSTAASVIFGAIAGAFTDAKDSAGILEHVDSGTLVLDDIDYLPLDVQPSLLSFLDDGSFYRVGESLLARRADVRLIVTTNKNLNEQAQALRFSPDLLSRLSRFVLTVPPLRHRGRAVVRIAEFLLRDAAHTKGHRPGYWQLDRSAQQALMRHSWPCNVRELETVIGNLTVFVCPDDEIITATDIENAIREATFPGPTASAPPPPVCRSSADSLHSLTERIYRALCECRGNVTEAARLAGCSRTTVYKHRDHNGWTF